MSSLKSVIWADTQFVAVGEGCPGSGNWRALMMTSPDGRNWTRRFEGYRQMLKSVAWTGSRLLATGYDVDKDTGVAYSSPDGIDWTSQKGSGTGGGKGVTIWAGSRFVFVGTYVSTSPDGATWTYWNSGSPGALTSVVSTGTQLVAVGLTGTILTSPIQNTSVAPSHRRLDPSTNRGIHTPFRPQAPYTAAGRKVQAQEAIGR